tara:strand:- start:1582 stop:2598 length:1017 start_codon:yes stop_codon:yes gene_type:complete
MERKYNSIKRMDESRDYFKSLLNEQQMFSHICNVSGVPGPTPQWGCIDATNFPGGFSAMITSFGGTYDIMNPPNTQYGSLSDCQVGCVPSGTTSGTTGSTGTTGNYGNSAVLEMCPGVPTNPTNVPNPFNTSANSLTIDGNPVTQADIGETIQSGGGTKYTVQSVTPLTVPSQGNYSFTTSLGPCPRPIGTGTTCDISYNTPCASQHLTTGSQNSWTTFLNQRQTGWDSVGCQHLQNVVNWTTNQLNSGVTGNGTPLNPTQIARKTEKRDWAQCQGSQCGCTINMRPLTGGSTPNPLAGTGGIKPPPNPLAGTGGIKPEKEKLKEEFTRMKTLWKYNK